MKCEKCGTPLCAEEIAAEQNHKLCCQCDLFECLNEDEKTEPNSDPDWEGMRGLHILNREVAPLKVKQIGENSLLVENRTGRDLVFPATLRGKQIWKDDDS